MASKSNKGTIIGAAAVGAAAGIAAGVAAGALTDKKVRSKMAGTLNQLKDRAMEMVDEVEEPVSTRKITGKSRKSKK